MTCWCCQKVEGLPPSGLCRGCDVGLAAAFEGTSNRPPIPRWMWFWLYTSVTVAAVITYWLVLQ